MRETLIAGNWKMNTSVSEARELASAMAPGLDAVEVVTKVLCPPFTSLAAVGEVVAGTGIGLGAQNLYFESNGAFTGEISPEMVAELCQYVIIGHSERRHVLGETDDDVAKKVEAAIGAGLRPILCVGETIEEREEGRAEVVVESQVEQGLARVDSINGIIIAYEPVWAVGTSKASTPDGAESMMSLIRGVLGDRFGVDASSSTPLLYGGSVKADNVAEFVRQPDVDGALVGGASLEAEGFIHLVTNAAAAVL